MRAEVNAGERRTPLDLLWERTHSQKKSTITRGVWLSAVPIRFSRASSLLQ